MLCLADEIGKVHREEINHNEGHNHKHIEIGMRNDAPEKLKHRVSLRINREHIVDVRNIVREPLRLKMIDNHNIHKLGNKLN